MTVLCTKLHIPQKSTRHLSFLCRTRCGAHRQNTSLLKIVEKIIFGLRCCCFQPDVSGDFKSDNFDNSQFPKIDNFDNSQARWEHVHCMTKPVVVKLQRQLRCHVSPNHTNMSLKVRFLCALSCDLQPNHVSTGIVPRNALGALARDAVSALHPGRIGADGLCRR